MTRIIPLDRYNWESCLKVKLTPEQESYLPSVLYSLAQAKFENLNPLGIVYKDQMVGFLMYGIFGGICWINRIMIDQDYQRLGIGSNALRQLIYELRQKYHCREIRASYAKNNHSANLFFAQMGFQPINEALDDETVVRYMGR